MTSLDWRRFADPEQLAEQFADDAAGILQAAVETRGSAYLAVSGGSTPALFFRALSRRELDWSRVTVIPVDERFVPATSERSNEKLIRDNLLQGQAQSARLMSLFHDLPSVDKAAEVADRHVSALPFPVDLAVLGMGNDGHTASYFPDSPQLSDATNPSAPRSVLAITAPSADEPRLTLTLPVLLAAKHLVLHIEGEEKRAVLNEALAQASTDEKPIVTVLRQAPSNVEIYWAPKKGE